MAAMLGTEVAEEEVEEAEEAGVLYSSGLGRLDDVDDEIGA